MFATKEAPEQDRTDRGSRGSREHRDEREHRPGRHRGPVSTAVGRSLGKWLGIGLVSMLVIAVAGPFINAFWKSVDPFGSKTVDRSQPALMQALTQLHDYRAASATFQVVVDVEKDAKWMPAAIRGERTVLLAQGSVDAGVSLTGLNEASIAVDQTTKSVRITLPHARLRAARLDLSQTRVLSHKRGLLDRLGSTFGGPPSSEKPLLQLAERKLTAAAKASTVRTAAEANTRDMLTGLVHGLGFTTVDVVFADPVKPTPSATRAAAK